MRGGGPPLSVGPAGRAERLLPLLQAGGPSPRTKRGGRRCHPFPAPLSKWHKEGMSKEQLQNIQEFYKSRYGEQK